MSLANASVCGETSEPLLGGGERGFLLAKRKADLASAIAGVVVEAGARHDCDADFLN